MLSIVFLGITFNVLSPLVRWQAQTGLAAVSSLPFAITIVVQLSIKLPYFIITE